MTTKIVTTPCPVPECRFVAVFEYEGDGYVGAKEVARHVNENHDIDEIPGGGDE